MDNNIVLKCGKDPFNVPKLFSYKDFWVDCTILCKQVYFFSTIRSN